MPDFETLYYDDLTTEGIGADAEAVPLVYRKPYISHKVPGRQLTGTIGHASYVMRFPDKDNWNGKVIIGATPAVRNAFSLDLILSDIILQKGYAYAACDKATPGLTLRDPSRSIEEWLTVYRQLTIDMAEETIRSYGRAADCVYITGVSNGGYVTRAMLERFPELYDGGVEWEGVLWAPKERHLLSSLAEWVKAYPVYADLTGGTIQTEKRDAYEKMLAFGLHPDSEPFWKTYYETYWLVSLWLYGRNLDPSWQGFKKPWQNSWLTDPGDLLYEWEEREAFTQMRMAPLYNSGKLTRPLLSVAGNWDCLIPYKYHAEAYASLVESAGASQYHRLYQIEKGNHVDGLLLRNKGAQQPVHSYYEAALLYLEDWAEEGILPPDSGSFQSIEQYYPSYHLLKTIQ